MKYVLISLFALILHSCSHNIPIANIEFEKIEEDNKDSNDYFLYFSSNVELINNLKQEHNGAKLKCLFKKENIDKKDFKNHNEYALKSISEIEIVSNSSVNENIYNYKIGVSFKEYKKDGSSYFINKDDITKFLKLLNEELNCLNCVITAVTYMNITERYISNTMCLPINELKKTIEK